MLDANSHKAHQSKDIPGADGRLLQFGRLLRDNGFAVGPADVSDAIRYCAQAVIFKERPLRQSLRVLFCRSRFDLSRFDELFDAYWHQRVGKKRSHVKSSAIKTMSSLAGHDPQLTGGAKGVAQYFEWADSAGNDNNEGNGPSESDLEDMRQGGASPHSSDKSTDFGKITDPEEFERLLMFAQKLGARLRHRLSRRRKIDARGRQLHFRRTLRRAIQTGGIPCKLEFKIKKKPPLHIVIFVDVSGSMDPYSLFFARFAHAMTGGFSHVDTYLFHTRLLPITGALYEANPIKMMLKLAAITKGWSGGTKIGESLATFNAVHARGLKKSRTIAILISDGYDTSPVEQLSVELGKLKKRCRKLIWLNPLLGRESYQPISQGMQAAQKHIDLFAPAHNLRSLLQLEEALVRAY